MIAAISWVPKGVAKTVPEVSELPSKDEIEELLQTGVLDSLDGEHDEDGEMDMESIKEADEVALASVAAEALGKDSNDIAEAFKDLDMDNYDVDGDNDNDDGVNIFTKGLGDAYYPSNEVDPYLKDKDDNDSEEEEDMIIRAEDSIIVCARNEEEISQLEVYVLEETEDGPNLYVHHDIIISSFPLSTAWLDCPLKGGERGNFVAVGSMEPSIEIWDLDIIDEIEPSVVLGGIIEKKKKGKKKSIKYKEDSHTDSVLGLAWNKEFRNILASASADKQVKIWDVATGKCSITMEHHTDKTVSMSTLRTILTCIDKYYKTCIGKHAVKKWEEHLGMKVQAVAFCHHVPQILLSGSFDHSIVMKDGRKPSHSGYRWSVVADVESLAWDPHTEHSFVVSLENGMIHGFDIRAASSNSDSEMKPSFTLHAHDKAASSISYNPSAPNLLASGSIDKMVKLWDLSNNQPSCVASQNPKAGAVFSVSFSVENPFWLAIGGSKGKLEVWDTSSDAGVSKRYANSIAIKKS